MHSKTGSLWLAAALALAGCDKAAPPSGPAAGPAKAGVVVTTDATVSAEQVARQARGDVSCPARTATAARPGEAPVDDVMGVRPGLTYEEAAATVLCAHELLVLDTQPLRGFDIKSFGQKVRQGFSARFAEERVAKTSKQILQEMQRDAMARGANAVREDFLPGQSRWYVGTMGVPGQERVLSVGREERYAADQSPTVDALRAALRKKYGATPTRELAAGPTQMPTLRWAHDPAGRIVAAGTPLFARCVGHPDPKVGISLNPDCGVVVEALLVPRKDNPDLVDRLLVSVVDQGGGYRMIAATEQALAQADQQRRAQEVEKAAKTGKGPSL
ncbi:MAG: hypothetical protein K8R60_06465 [Burkholderiales bacterium]|nr:hypothetical protein [Burkholderiales bacterium]